MNIIISCSHIWNNCILIFVRLVFTLISLYNSPSRPKQISIICLYDGFLVITGSMLKFVAKGDTEKELLSRLFIWYVPKSFCNRGWGGTRKKKIQLRAPILPGDALILSHKIRLYAVCVVCLLYSLCSVCVVFVY